MNPKLYSRCNNMQTNDAKSILENLNYEFDWENCEYLLDIGSGCGNVTANILRPFVSKSCNIIGSDISSEMVNFANQHNAADNLMFKQLDIQDNFIWDSWKEETFDKIFSFYCLHWIKNLRQAMVNMYSLLKPNGEIFLVFLDSNPVYNVYKAMSSNPKWFPYLKNLDEIRSPLQSSKNSANDFEKLLVSTEFKAVCVNIEKREFTYASKESLSRMIETINPFYNEIPQELHDEFIEDFQKNLSKSSCKYEIKKDGTMEVNYNLLVARARK